VSADRARGDAEGLLPTESGVADIVLAARHALAWADRVEPPEGDDAALEAANDWLNEGGGWDDLRTVQTALRIALEPFSAAPRAPGLGGRKEPR